MVKRKKMKKKNTSFKKKLKKLDKKVSKNIAVGFQKFFFGREFKAIQIDKRHIMVIKLYHFYIQINSHKN